MKNNYFQIPEDTDFAVAICRSKDNVLIVNLTPEKCSSEQLTLLWGSFFEILDRFAEQCPVAQHLQGIVDEHISDEVFSQVMTACVSFVKAIKCIREMSEDADGEQDN